MNKIVKSRSTPSTLVDNTTVSINSQNALSYQRISSRQPQLQIQPPTTPRTEQSYIIMSSFVNDHTNDPLTRSILIDSAARQPGFLPHDYRIANTFETIQRKRVYHKTPTKLPAVSSPKMSRSSTRVDVFGNSLSSMSKLAEQRLILRDKTPRKKHNTTPILDKSEKILYNMSDADFASDIPSALELILKKTKRKSTMEKHLLDTFKRERLQQARYRLLPINRAPYG